MKTTSVILATLATVVYSQSLPDIPQCALACFATALTTDGCSGLTDFECHCQKPELIPSVTPCVQAACSSEDEANVISVVQDTCAGVGHPISIPGGSSDTITPVPLPTPTEEPSIPSSGDVTPTPTSETNVESMPSPTDDVTSVTPVPLPSPTPSEPFTGAAAIPTAMGGYAAIVLAGAAALM